VLLSESILSIATASAVATTAVTDAYIRCSDPEEKCVEQNSVTSFCQGDYPGKLSPLEKANLAETKRGFSVPKNSNLRRQLTGSWESGKDRPEADAEFPPF